MVALAAFFVIGGCSADTDTEITSDTSTTVEVDEETTEETSGSESSTSSTTVENEEETTQPADDAAAMTEALETLNLSTCDEIENSLSRESCITSVVMAQVRATGVTDLCVNITDEPSRADCMALDTAE